MTTTSSNDILCIDKMLNGFRFLLLIVLALGIVLIYGYTHLTFKSEPQQRSQKYETHSPPAEGAISLMPMGIKSRIFEEEADSEVVPMQVLRRPSPTSTMVSNTRLPNRTAEAGNQNIVVFNRVPKTGSEMFEHFGKLLSSVLGYHTYIDPQIMTLFPTEVAKRAFAQQFTSEIKDSGVYYRHMTFFNFTTHQRPTPIYASIVRHPIDRMVSWFYYQRWRNRPDDDQPEEICNKNTKWKRFCQTMKMIRNQDYVKDEAWYNMTFDECVAKKHPECVYSEGSGFLLQHNMPFDFRSQMMFFCGNTPECALFNSKRVLSKAKTIVEKIYSVVGVLEDLDLTLEAFQAYIPKFFRAAKELYHDNLSNLTITHTNKNPFKKAISKKTRAFLEKKFSVEIEFYEFCQQRLRDQVKAIKVGLDTRSTENPAEHWPDQVANDSIILADDYVLL